MVGHNTGPQTKIISSFHSSTLGGHFGIQATYHRLKKLFVWPELKSAIESFIKQCQIYQQAKTDHCKYPGLLQPLPIPEHSWQDISMDFIEGLPKSNGYSVILVVFDGLTKYAYFLPLKHPFSDMQVAQLFFSQVIKHHGILRSIVFYRDKIFTNIFWQMLFKLVKTDLKLNSANHPQTDGQTERVNQCLEMFLCCAVHDTPSKWSHWLPSVRIVV